MVYLISVLTFSYGKSYGKSNGLLLPGYGKQPLEASSCYTVVYNSPNVLERDILL